MRWRRLAFLLVVAILTGCGGHGSAVAGAVRCDRTLSSGDVADALVATPSGSTLCLRAGSYAFNAQSIVKSRTTIVRPAAGVSRDVVIIAYADMRASKRLEFRGVTLRGGVLGTPTDPATNIKLRDVRWAGCLLINQPTSAALNITLDGGLFDSVGSHDPTSPCGDDGRIRIFGGNTGDHGSGKKSLVIRRIDFPWAGCTDAIELTGGAQGVTIGPGNTFHNIVQNDPVVCSTHVDPVQFYGASEVTITGNWFHHNSTGIMSSNGNGDGATITNNVFSDPGDNYRRAITDCGGDDWTIRHNTFVGTRLYVCGSDTPLDTTSNTTVSDNYLGSGFEWQGQAPFDGITADHNLVARRGVFIGGASPASRAGFRLSRRSRGARGASDGSAVGIR